MNQGQPYEFFRQCYCFKPEMPASLWGPRSGEARQLAIQELDASGKTLKSLIMLRNNFAGLVEVAVAQLARAYQLQEKVCSSINVSEGRSEYGCRVFCDLPFNFVVLREGLALFRRQLLPFPKFPDIPVFHFGEIVVLEELHEFFR